MNKNGRRCGPAAHGRATRRRGLAGVFEANNDVGKVAALIQQTYRAETGQPAVPITGQLIG